ncbi:hypothetical protein [Mesorhizobium japonicum]|uniref:hypothetical protein n=1 Tax=Mesorhizobium japonicum TaxID=2066070 RepID=UPI003B5BFA9C
MSPLLIAALIVLGALLVIGAIAALLCEGLSIEEQKREQIDAIREQSRRTTYQLDQASYAFKRAAREAIQRAQHPNS